MFTFAEVWNEQTKSIMENDKEKNEQDIERRMREMEERDDGLRKYPEE